MKPIYSLLVSFLLLIALVHAATPPPTNIPISGMPIATNAIDNAYFPMIQPYPGRFTNDNFRITISNMFRGRTSETVTNIYAQTIVVSNLFATNIYATFVTNTFNNFTNSYITNLWVTNFFSSNVTVIANTYTSNFYTTNIVIGNTNFFNVNQFSYDPNGDNIVNIKSGPLITNLINVGTITLGGVAYTFDNTLVAGGVLTDPLGNGVLQWTGGTLLWTNNAGTLTPTTGFDVLVTNLVSVDSLSAYGAFFIPTSLSSNMVAGENDLSVYQIGSMLLQGSSTDPADTSVNLNSGGSGQFLFIENGVSSGFTIYDGTPLWDSSGYIILMPGLGDWRPTQRGETMFLKKSQNQNWQEIGRFGGSTNSSGGESLWKTNLGSANISPFVAPTLFTINDLGSIGIGLTNIFYDKDIGIFHRADLEGNRKAWINIGAADAISANYFGEWWANTGTNDSVMDLTSSNAGATFDHVWTASHSSPSTFFYYQMLSNSVPTLELDGYTGDIYTIGSITFGPGLTNIIFRDGTDIIYTNTALGATRIGVDVNGKPVITLQEEGTATTTAFSQSGGSGGVSSGSILSLTGGTSELQLSGSSFNFANQFTGALTYWNGYNNGSTNYSRLATYHTGTNGVVVFDSQASGIAGDPRPFQFQIGGSSLAGSVGDRLASQPPEAPPFGYVFTNIINTNCVSGDVDIFTVPSGKRFMFNGARIIGYSAGNSFLQYKTNGVYYHLSNATTAFTTNTVNSLVANGTTALILEEGEVAAINVDATSICYMFGILFDNTSPLKMPRLNTLPNGITTLYTCPAGKFAIQCNTSAVFPSLINGPGVWYLNNSSGSRTIDSYLVPSGASANKTTLINTTTTATGLGNSATPTTAGMLRPGDSLAIGVDVGANVGAGVLLLEISQ